MALCKVITKTEGWNVGDHVEASGARLKELVTSGIVIVLVPDTEEPKVIEVKKVKTKGVK